MRLILTFIAILVSCNIFGQDSALLVYDEGAEFKITKTTGLTIKDCPDTSYHGNESLNIGSWDGVKYIYFISDSLLDAGNYDTLKFYARLKKRIAGGVGNIRITLLSGNNVDVSNTITLDTANGFKKSVTDWQQITIPLNDLAFYPNYPTVFNRIKISLAGISDGFYLDYMQMHVRTDDVEIIYPLPDTIDTDTAVIKVIKPFNPHVPFGRFDTTRVLMTVIDTAQYYGSFFGLDGQYYQDTSIQSPQVIFMFGYKVTFDATQISFLLSDRRYNATINLIPPDMYLDEFKKPLRRGLIVIPKNIIDIK